MLGFAAILLGYFVLAILTLMIWPAVELWIKRSADDKVFYHFMAIFWPIGLPLAILFAISEVFDKFSIYDNWIKFLKARHQAKTAPKIPPPDPSSLRARQLPPPLPTMETVDGYNARVDQFPMPTADFRSMNCHSCGYLIKQ